MTCSEVLSSRAISGLVRPCQTIVAMSISVQFICSLGDMVHLLLFKDGCGKNDALPALLDSGAQEQSTEMLFHGSRADFQLRCDLLVTATLYQKVEHLLIAAGDFNLIETDHRFLSATVRRLEVQTLLVKQVVRQMFALGTEG